MDIIRLASVDVPRDSAHDSTAVVVLRVTESQQHIIKGEAGFISSVVVFGGRAARAGLTGDLEVGRREDVAPVA